MASLSMHVVSEKYLTYFKTFKQADSYRKRVIKENKY